MGRVVVFKNGSRVDGKLLPLSDTLDDLLMAAAKKLNISAKVLYTAQGGEIDDITLIRDDDVLYVSSGEPYIASSNTLPRAAGKCYISMPHDMQIATVPGTTFTNPDWLLLNVGGKHFATTRSTLTTKEPNSMLACMIASEGSALLCPSSVDNNGAFLIDRSPVYFEPILNYLRHGQLILDKSTNPQGVLEEARFFGIESLVKILEKMVQDEQKHSSDSAALTRRDVINTLISTSYSSELRFQGVNLCQADLSRLDLRHINFKYANLHRTKLSGANLSYCCLERTDLSHANLEGAILLGVKMLCANLEGANLRSCNMEDPAGNRANMEGVNLKGANLEGSQMAGVNLRVATLKNANLQNCDLRGAVLAGADLENCDLSGSDLHEANLRGANLKDAAFELMLTPLHMSQAIR
ncbi:BTB/POZ domain-containing protein KCTD9-like [Stegodyphus dumicola]|uniref:BTB/POZ domain-containing protein KCTD9-like n=1 Tax=Stegodyphus dumicola TaxID=202533 RepID=UPI0015AE58F3|nr:BTB/POZ domain-containing protein KCTD9-like [Stegodyphus dumicola]